ncbi:MAG: hypothetical protein Q8O06_03825 [Acetobacterium sp.]|nr:hypothetical protein [Acetobacterium sp.]
MANEEREKMRKMLAQEAHILSTPIDFDQLIKDGLLKKIGKSYYVDNIHDLPENVGKRITSVSQTKNGTKVTFSKETKSMKKLADKSEKYRG